MAAPCCPSGSHGPLAADMAVLTGFQEKEADLDCYFSGQKEKPSTVILAFSDVFGPYSGRHRRICDQMAEAVPNSLVCMPDLFHGDPVAPDYSSSSWASLRLKLHMPKMLYRIRYRYSWGILAPQIQKLTDALAAKYPEVPMFAYGFCFGGYVVAKASTLGAFRGVVGFHPSLLVGKLQYSPHGQNEEDLAKEVRCPQLMIPASNDDNHVKPGGGFMSIVTAAHPASKSVVYENMVHGWMTRGADDKMIPQKEGVETVMESQASALKLAAEFFLQLAQPSS